jgi:hypothetical protein
MKYKNQTKFQNRDRTTTILDPANIHSNGFKAIKYNYKDILDIVFVWLMAISLI